MKITYGTIKTTIARVAGLCVTDTNILSLVNRACERLMAEGNWVGTFQRMRVCTHARCITWPRAVETIESYAICGVPGQVRNQWYEFLEGGPGVMSDAACVYSQLIDRGQAVAFDDVTGTSKKLAVYCDAAEAATAYIILRFFTNLGERARSTYGGEQIDGERIDLAGGLGIYRATTNICGPYGLVEVVKTTTVGMVRLYEYDTVNLTYKPLAYYEPSETVPTYRRSLVPGISCDNEEPSTCHPVIDANVKLAYAPVAEDDDVLPIQSAEAVRLAVQAIMKEEKDLMADAATYWQMAIRILTKQLESYLGHGATVPIRMVNATMFGAGIPYVR